MRESLLSLLRCPACASTLRLDDAVREETEEIDTDKLACSTYDVTYPVTCGISRFVPPHDYADNFGLQWNAYRRTQLDSLSGQPISHDRFARFTGWSPEDWSPEKMHGDCVLDVGSETGQFAEIAIATGAHVVAVDYSTAIDEERENLRDTGNINFIQADATALPFKPQTFDRGYCLGVIQHTPAPAQTVASLADQVRPGGRLAVDLYPAHWKNLFFAKYWIRALTKRLTVELGHAIAKAVFPVLYLVSQAIGRIPKVRHYLKYLTLIANYKGVYLLDQNQLREWALLDTFAPTYNQPQTMPTICVWFEKAQFTNINVFHHGFHVGRGIKAKA